MNTKTTTALIALVLLGALAAPATAAVNCAQVRKYLATGRTVDEIAETMVVPVEDVKKCQAEGDGARAGGAPAPAATPAK